MRGLDLKKVKIQIALMYANSNSLCPRQATPAHRPGASDTSTPGLPRVGEVVKTTKQWRAGEKQAKTKYNGQKAFYREFE